MRVLVPTKLRMKLLDKLHQGHPGISKMKAVSRSYFWWPGLDKDIEELGKSCKSCQSVKNSPTAAPLYPWSWPSKPWECIHVNFAGPFQGSTFLIVVDAYSKWPKVFRMSSTTADKTIEVLRHLFAAQGLPELVTTDPSLYLRSSPLLCEEMVSVIFAQLLIIHHQMASLNGSCSYSNRLSKQARMMDAHFSIVYQHFFSPTVLCHMQQQECPHVSCS